MMSSRKEDLLLEFEVARQNRRFEIQMFWQRANYFSVLNTALAIGAYSVGSSAVALFICGFGALCAFLWVKTNLGAKYWQSFWENEVRRLADELGIYALSLSDAQIYAQSNAIEAHEDNRPHKRWLNRKIRKNPSVSSNMIWLSIFTFIAWILAAAVFLGLMVYGFFCGPPIYGKPF